MSTVSVCMIVKNEESILALALESIAPIADEIIIIDTGSTDKTVEIAQKFTKHIHHFDWIDDFSAARNFADSFAMQDYICRWDADWILQKDSLLRLKALKKNNFDKAELVYFSWNLEFAPDNTPLRTEPYYFLYKRDVFHWQSPIHNELVVNKSHDVIKLYDMAVQVDHWKDPEIKSHRYKQTLEILEKALAKRDEHYVRLLFFYAQALIFEEEFDLALAALWEYERYVAQDDTQLRIVILEKIILCLMNIGDFVQARFLIEKNEKELSNELGFWLIAGDVWAMYDAQKASSSYEKYITLLSTVSSNEIRSVDHERQNVHPRFMLGQLSILTGNVQMAYDYLTQALDLTRLPEMRESATIALSQIETQIETKIEYDTTPEKNSDQSSTVS